MKVLFCGGREFNDREMVAKAFDRFQPSFVIAGGARGADMLAEQEALRRGIAVARFPAAWEAHGRKAGAIRNASMLKFGAPGLVVAFPGGVGTRDMCKKASAAGITTIVAEWGANGDLLFLRPRT